MVGNFQGHSKFIENLDDSPNVNSKQLRTIKKWFGEDTTKFWAAYNFSYGIIANSCALLIIVISLISVVSIVEIEPYKRY